MSINVNNHNSSAACCGVRLRSVDDLLNHFLTYHPSSLNFNRKQKKQFRCMHCKKYYSTNFNLKRHIAVCSKDPVIASLKDKNQKEREELRRKNRRCKICSKSFTRNQKLRLHESGYRRRKGTVISRLK